MQLPPVNPTPQRSAARPPERLALEQQPRPLGDRLEFRHLARGPLPKPSATVPAAPQAVAWASELPVRRDLLPGTPAMPDRSDIPGYTHLQCGEFAYKYFKAQGKPYPTLGQPYNFLMTGEPYPANLPTKDYQRLFNGGSDAPKAGDILVAKGPGGGEFHTAIVTRVDGDSIHVIQANVPHATQGLVETDLPMEVVSGKFQVAAFPTSHLGYQHDFAVVGWIHPTGASALPGAPH